MSEEPGVRRVGLLRGEHATRSVLRERVAGKAVVVVDFSPASSGRFHEALRTFFEVARSVCGRADRQEKVLLVARLTEGVPADGRPSDGSEARLFLLRRAVRAAQELADETVDVFGVVVRGYGSARLDEALALLASGSSGAPPSGSTLLLVGDRARPMPPRGAWAAPGRRPPRSSTRGPATP